ncbi:aminomethyltransferase family protein [Lentibacter algarum]|uniref:aminomethyltransferase family protein n=1 Tax=Lentibacter algarum TaxID=576131 RepID=UPI001C098486|nr:aminomethyltransferase family protein [Lentibacter algarum]MBU2983156.1 aminomethyltransferase family protein [Lentibacter algarum]
MEAKKTPLYHAFIKRGANVRNAGGYFAPIAFSDPRTEHLTTREKAGLFEIFGQFLVEVTGSDAERLINETHVADVTKLPDMKGTYCGILNDKGGFLDDVIVWRVNAGKFWVCPAPHRVNVIVDHLKDAGKNMEVNVVSLGYRYTSLSIQGPQSRACLQELTNADLTNDALKPFEIVETTLNGVDDVIISRTGFTGELGFELFIPTQNAEDLYEAILEAGANKGLVPCGVAAMVSLRIEKRYPIFGRDITEDNNPVEAGLGWTIRAKETNYPGKAVVEALKKTGTDRALVLIEMPEGADVPEAGAALTSAGQEVGQVTSAGMGHSVGRALAMGYVTREMAVDGQPVDVGEVKAAKIHTGAIYDPKNTRSRG